MGLDTEKRWVLEATQQGWALVEQENQEVEEVKGC